MQKDFVSMLEAKANNEAIFVYPDAAINGAKRSLDPSANGLDVAFFDALVKNIGDDYCVDRSQVYSIGFSNGGFFTNSLAQARPDALKGIVSIAGGGGGGSPVNALIVHSKDDSNVGVGNGYQSVRAWASAAECAPQEPSQFPLQTCTPLKGCKKAYVGFCLWGQTKPGQGTHDWPRFASANDDIWRFLSLR
jgi:poly(3-hydroxybutyrate) depolymerase